MKFIGVCVSLCLAVAGVWAGGMVPGDPGSPLFLTPYITSGKLAEGRAAAEVPQLLPNLKSYAGYYTVDPEYDSNLFLWYFPSEDPSAPVVVWLQGGPGSSSLFGLFYENGPISINLDGLITSNPYSWSRVANLVFIDNPVGTGFSFTNSSEGYVRNQTQVGDALHTALDQFLTLFPRLRTNELYITGESYGGKYVPAFAYTIHQRNAQGCTRMNLAGIAVGNGLVDPYRMMQYGDYLYQLGLIDSNTLQEFHVREDDIRKNIDAENWKAATEGFGQLILGWGQGNTLFYNSTGFGMYYNFLKTEDDNSQDLISRYVNDPWVRSAIHVGSRPYNDGSEVQQHLTEDIMKSTMSLVETLVEHYHVIIYNGQLDIICAYPLTLQYLKDLNWCGAKQYAETSRHQWIVNTEIAGYAREVRSPNCTDGGWLTEVVVRNAGHMVPHDQPIWSLDLIARLVHKKPF